MKTIIVGFRDQQGLSKPEIVCGPEVDPLEQAEVIDDAKRLHRFPSEFQRVEQYALGEAVDIAIFISDEAATAAQNNDKRRRQLEKEQREKDAAQTRAQSNLILANKTFSDFVKKRNLAIAAVAAQNNLLSAALSDKDRAKVIEKIKELKPAVDQSIAEFAVVLVARDIIKNPKATAADIAGALNLLKDPAKAAAAKAALEKADTDRLAAEQKAALDKIEAERVAALKAETERLAAEKTEADRIAAEKAAGAPPAA
jgi:hypothetical protein